MRGLKTVCKVSKKFSFFARTRLINKEKFSKRSYYYNKISVFSFLFHQKAVSLH